MGPKKAAGQEKAKTKKAETAADTSKKKKEDSGGGRKKKQTTGQERRYQVNVGSTKKKDPAPRKKREEGNGKKKKEKESANDPTTAANPIAKLFGNASQPQKPVSVPTYQIPSPENYGDMDLDEGLHVFMEQNTRAFRNLTIFDVDKADKREWKPCTTYSKPNMPSSESVTTSFLATGGKLEDLLMDPKEMAAIEFSLKSRESFAYANPEYCGCGNVMEGQGAEKVNCTSTCKPKPSTSFAIPQQVNQGKPTGSKFNLSTSVVKPKETSEDKPAVPKFKFKPKTDIMMKMNETKQEQPTIPLSQFDPVKDSVIFEEPFVDEEVTVVIPTVSKGECKPSTSDVKMNAANQDDHEEEEPVMFDPVRDSVIFEEPFVDEEVNEEIPQDVLELLELPFYSSPEELGGNNSPDSATASLEMLPCALPKTPMKNQCSDESDVQSEFSVSPDIVSNRFLEKLRQVKAAKASSLTAKPNFSGFNSHLSKQRTPPPTLPKHTTAPLPATSKQKPGPPAIPKRKTPPPGISKLPNLPPENQQNKPPSTVKLPPSNPPFLVKPRSMPPTAAKPPGSKLSLTLKQKSEKLVKETTQVPDVQPLGSQSQNLSMGTSTKKFKFKKKPSLTIVSPPRNNIQPASSEPILKPKAFAAPMTSHRSPEPIFKSKPFATPMTSYSSPEPIFRPKAYATPITSHHSPEPIFKRNTPLRTEAPKSKSQKPLFRKQNTLFGNLHPSSSRANSPEIENLSDVTAFSPSPDKKSVVDLDDDPFAESLPLPDEIPVIDLDDDPISSPNVKRGKEVSPSPPLSPILNLPSSTQDFYVGEYSPRSETRSPTVSSPSSPRVRRPRRRGNNGSANPFIEHEAQVVNDDGSDADAAHASGSDFEFEGLDDYDESFVTQDMDLAVSDSQQMMYLESVKDAVPAKFGRIEKPLSPKYYGHNETDMTEASYEDDSFCQPNDEVEYMEVGVFTQAMNVAKAELAVGGGSGGRQTRRGKREAVAVKKPEPQKPKQRRRIVTLDDSSSDDDFK